MPHLSAGYTTFVEQIRRASAVQGGAPDKLINQIFEGRHAGTSVVDVSRHLGHIQRVAGFSMETKVVRGRIQSDAGYAVDYVYTIYHFYHPESWYSAICQMICLAGGFVDSRFKL